MPWDYIPRSQIPYFTGQAVICQQRPSPTSIQTSPRMATHNRRGDNLISMGRQEDMEREDGTGTLTSLSGCQTSPVEGGSVPLVPAGGWLWGCCAAFPLGPGAISQTSLLTSPRINLYSG